MSEKIKLDPDHILNSAVAMDNFIHELAHWNLCNCSGSAYRNVRLCLYRNGILLKSAHHTDHYCSIVIATDRTAKVISGSQDSCYPGNVDPSVDRGELVLV